MLKSCIKTDIIEYVINFTIGLRNVLLATIKLALLYNDSRGSNLIIDKKQVAPNKHENDHLSTFTLQLQKYHRLHSA